MNFVSLESAAYIEAQNAVGKMVAFQLFFLKKKRKANISAALTVAELQDIARQACAKEGPPQDVDTWGNEVWDIQNSASDAVQSVSHDDVLSSELPRGKRSADQPVQISSKNSAGASAGGDT